MKNLVFSVISLMVLVITFASCNNDDSYSNLPSLTGIYSGFNASTGDSTTVIIGPAGTYDHISVKSATKETVIEFSTMMTVNNVGKVATISDQGLGGYSGTVKFSDDGQTATLELSNAQGYNFTAKLTKAAFPTSIAGTWFNASTGASIKVQLFPTGVCDQGTISFNASDTEHSVVVGAITKYGTGRMIIDGNLATFSLGYKNENATITVTYKNTDYTYTFVGKKD